MPFLGTRGAASARGFGLQRITTTPPGQQQYTNPGTYTWIAPAGITSVSVVAVGAGAGGYWYGPGGNGGNLTYLNNISVTPGQSYTVFVGASGTPGQDSYFINASTVKASGGRNARTSNAASVPDNQYGGLGGTPQDGGNNDWGSGGGAAGYTGNGGNGRNYTTEAGAGAGGGGGGGYNVGTNYPVYGGGGVGLLGQGANGGIYGGGGSGGSSASTLGGLYGGGGGGGLGGGGHGAVRIIWGAGRSFPSTNTGNV